MKGKRLITGFLLITLVALIGTSCGTITPPASTPKAESVLSGIFSQQSTGIWVTGEGKVSVVPDVAILSLGVQVQAESVAEAQSTAATAMNAVVAELDNFGIAQKDIKTSQFSIFPLRRWSEKDGREILIGYQVTNTVTAKVRKIEDTGAIIDAAARAGGDYIVINSVSFTVDEPSAYYEDARQEAMQDAEAKAEQLAELGDVELGKPTYINEYVGYVPPIIYRDFDEGAAITAETGISPGEIEIQLTVEVHYNIK